MPNPSEGESPTSGRAFRLIDADRDGAHRVAALRAYDILDRLPPEVFDRVSEMAANIFDAPIAALRIGDKDRIWCRSPDGFDLPDHAAAPRFSGFSRSSAAPWRVTRDMMSRSLTMPMVAIEFGLRFHVSAPLVTEDGHEIGALCVIDRNHRPVDQRQSRLLQTLAGIAMDQLEMRKSALATARKAESLAGEADHRVMNSLQFVAGLLEMQSRTVKTTEAAAQLTLAASRITAVARVHRHFAISEESQRVPMLAYLQHLCGELSTILDVPIDVEGSEASVPSSHILAIGFSVNEFIANANKHGAPPIKVSFTPSQAGMHRVSVADEGGGLPKEFALGQQNRSDGLGMRVVTALTSQIGGSLAVGVNASGRGACFTIAFPCA
jgi:two-component sensor histidine kinase